MRPTGKFRFMMSHESTLTTDLFMYYPRGKTVTLSLIPKPCFFGYLEWKFQPPGSKIYPGFEASIRKVK